MVGAGPSQRPGAQLALVRRKSLIGVRQACPQLWGDAGLAAVHAALPEDVRDRTAGLQPLPEWLPLNDLIAWHEAIWNGPAQQDELALAAFARATIDEGFGRVKRFVIAGLTPQALAMRVAQLWRDEYSTGTLETLSIDEHDVVLSLRDHVYVVHPLMRSVIGEVYRYVLSMARVKNVTESHSVRSGALQVALHWE